jgi:hypothetical protein
MNRQRIGLLTCSAVLLGSLSLVRDTAGAAGASDLPRILKFMSDDVAEVTPELLRPYLRSAFAVETLGDVVTESVNEKIESAAKDGQVKNLAGWLETSFADSVEIKKYLASLSKVSSNTPSYPQKDYCDQVRASNEEIRDIQDEIDLMTEVAGLAAKYKRVMPALDQLSAVMRDYWFKVNASGLISEGTSLLADQYLYWTSPHMECGTEVEVCAGFLIVQASINWDQIEKEVQSRHKSLTERLELLKAYHGQFYRSSQATCGASSRQDSLLEADLDQILGDVTLDLEESRADRMTAGARDISQQLRDQDVQPDTAVVGAAGVDGTDRGAAANVPPGASRDSDCEAPLKEYAACQERAVRGNSMCGTYRATVSCQERVLPQLRACPVIAADFRDSLRQNRQSAAQVCTN